jgi:glycosyltransferase involved in cell wall biosynthesis
MEALGKTPRVLLVHDWLTGMRGGEKCLEILAKRWPTAELFTLLHKRGSTSAPIESLNIHTSILNHLPGVANWYRWLLPVMPWAVSRWRAPTVDLVVSFNHCVAKGVRVAGVPHVCYCFTPMRYAWHLRDSYFGKQRSLKDRLRSSILDRLREWDRQSANNVSHFIAISKTIQQRIRECYNRESVVIYPPVNTDFYTPTNVNRENYYLVVSALAPYKRIDLAIAACRRLKRKLVVIGSGQEAAKLAKSANSDVQLLGWQSNEEIREHMRRCKALIFPGEEDFGIVPVEALACGTPVIALGKGGATETIVPPELATSETEPVGHWFEEQTVESLVGALERFERAEPINPKAARKQAMKFAVERYREELFGYLDGVLRGAGAQRWREAG